ncbi:hypothetical protein [Sediminivirga luteola]|uniref:hypothetical protein n=1 Tax=Sediminivirga luteola TaxID=1774748 RepID=UPI001F5AA724|nr:hypothetical protein [Sediminivirga luteola]MCI2267141.1 hypothetical protein [Sediminivirga luteola]
MRTCHYLRTASRPGPRDTAATGCQADGLRAADAAHLATAVVAGADRFVTNNRNDFPREISEIDIVYPDELPEP